MSETDAERDALSALRESAAQDEEVPASVRGFLLGGARLDPLRLDALGRWWYRGLPVEHERVRQLFCRSVRRTTRGTWVLEVPPYVYPVLVDDAGWFVERVVPDGDGLRFRLRGGESVPATWDGLATDGDSALYVLLFDGRRARLVGSAHQYVLAGLAVDDEGWWLELGGGRHRVAMETAATAAEGAPDEAEGRCAAEGELPESVDQ